MSRPIKGKLILNCDIRVRVDAELNDKLLSYCDDNGIQRAKVIREALIEYLGK